MDSSVGVALVLHHVVTSFLFHVFSVVYADHSPALRSPQFCFDQSSTSLCLLSVEYPLEAAADYSDISCGYPGFEADCNDQSGQRPFINISNHIYHVLSISYESKEIHLVDKDVEASGGCPHPKRNFSFPSSLSWVNYNLSRNDGNITVFYNCSRVPANAEQHLLCSKEEYKTTNTPPSYVFNDYEFKWFMKRFDWYSNCAHIVVVPVLTNTGNYMEAMKRGFLMTWSANDWCEDCERSGGHCWSNSITTACACENGNSYNRTCPPHRGLSTGLKIAIGILSGIGGVLLVALLVFCKRSNHSFLSLSHWRNIKKSPT